MWLARLHQDLVKKDVASIIMWAMRAVLIINVLAFKTLAFNIFLLAININLACHSDGELNYQYITEKVRILLLVWNLVPWIALYTQVEILDCTVYS